jgi:oxygen-independent coproporphyrinogen-3 oxidase
MNNMTAIDSVSLKRQLPAEEPLVGNYFVAAYPPFSSWLPSQNEAVEEALQGSVVDEPLGIYVHIPFCHKKCDYCYYLSYVGASYDAVNQYIETVIRELALYARFPAIKRRPLSFLYFGGGTPSTLNCYQIRCLASGLRNVLPWTGIKEVTFECAPRSVNHELLETLREVGVTRLSMGVQSFDNSLLKLNGRIHLAEDVLRAYALIKWVGFDWVNLDLMAGLIGETPANWHDSVRRVIDLSPESVTIYQTEIPYNTVLYQDLKAGCLVASPIAWDEKRRRVDYGFQELERAGYTVVSGYTAAKDPVRHRFQYQEHVWRGGDMLGLGVASFSYVQGVHFQNQVTIDKYEDYVKRDALPVKRALKLRDWDQLVREFILQLKFGAVDTEAFRKKFGVDVLGIFLELLDGLVEEKLAVCEEGVVRLTREGLLRVDQLLPRFYDPQFQEVRYT